MFGLPPFQTGEGGFFVRRIRNHEKRHFCPRSLGGTRRCHAWRFVFHFPKVRGPGCVAQSGGLILRRKIEQPFKGACAGIHVRVQMAELLETLWDGEDCKVRRVAVGHFVPQKWSRYASVGKRTHRIRGTCRSILRVLVVVEEHAVTFLLPPLRGSQCRYTPLDRTRKG